MIREGCCVSACMCVGMTVSICMLESILRGEGRGVGIEQTEKQSEGATGRHTLTQTQMCY